MRTPFATCIARTTRVALPGLLPKEGFDADIENKNTSCFLAPNGTKYEVLRAGLGARVRNAPAVEFAIQGKEK